jgi:hypothetical protein
MEATWMYGYDETLDIGWYHYVLATDDSGTVRRESTAYFLADGTVLARRSQGNESGVGVAGGDTVRMRCEEPFRRWTTQQRATTERITPEAWQSGVVDHEGVSVEFDLTVEALSPGWSTEGPEGDRPPAFRVHQMSRGAARLTVDGRTTALAGPTFRSHSLRRREVPEFTGHIISGAVFPSGRAIGVMAYRGADGGPGRRARAYYFDGTEVHEAALAEASFLTAVRRTGDPVRYLLKTPVGQIEVTGETVAGHYSTLVPGARGPANGGLNTYGVNIDDERSVVQHKGFARFELDGERAVGACERSVIGSALMNGDAR